MAAKKRAEEDAERNMRNRESISEAIQQLFERRTKSIMARESKKTLDANARKFFALVKKQPFKADHFTMTAEFDHFSSPYLEALWDENYPAIKSKLLQFLQEHPVPLLVIKFEGEDKAKKDFIWTLHRLDNLAEVQKKSISQKQLKHFAQVPEIGIVAMATNVVCCDYNAELGQFTALENIEFEITPRERQKATPKRLKYITKPICPPFFAGHYRCVRNFEEVQVTGPPKKKNGDRTIVFRENVGSTGDTEIVGFHVWNKDFVILILDKYYGMQIFMIDTRTDKVALQEIEFHGTRSQVAQVNGVDEQALFVQHDHYIIEYRQTPAGFSKLRLFVGFLQEPFLFYLRCFHVGKKYLCVGTESFVSFYDMTAAVETEGQLVNVEADFHVRCYEPSDIFFVDPSESREVLVSSRAGVQLWTLK